MCIVEVISKDKKKSMEVCKLLELEGYETCMCESEKQIKASFSKFNNIRMFVLILQNARGDDVEDFVKFKENFLPYISNDKKIIIMSPKEINFPFGFAVGAVYFKKGYKGNTEIKILGGKK